MKKNDLLVNEKIVNTCQLPKDVIWGASLISITGNNEIVIENFKNIIKYQPDFISIQCKSYQINIIGNKLMIDIYTKEEIKICGNITEIKFS